MFKKLLKLYNTMLLKGCLHTHTTCSDGTLTPQQVALAYEEKGYDFIAFTDHDYLLKPGYDEIYNNVKSDMILFTGIEMTVFLKGYIHVNRIFGDNQLLHIFNHLPEYDLDIEQIMERLYDLQKMFTIDAMEITTKGFKVKRFDEMPFPHPSIVSDDAHTAIGIGRAWIELDAKRDKDSILKAIKHGDFWNCYC